MVPDEIEDLMADLDLPMLKGILDIPRVFDLRDLPAHLLQLLQHRGVRPANSQILVQLGHSVPQFLDSHGFVPVSPAQILTDHLALAPGSQIHKAVAKPG